VRKYFRPLIVAVAIAAGIGLSASPASATSGYGYDGQWPDISGCDSSAITAEQATIYQGNATIGYIQLRYSTTCRTAWARIISYYNNGVGEKAGIERNSDGKFYNCYTATAYSGGGYSCYTQMVYDGGVSSYAWGWSPNWYGSSANASTPSY
jgi:hypothetical protein